MKKTILPILTGILATPLIVFALSVFLPYQGGTGTSITPTLGQILIGTSGGVYTPVATSSLGITASVVWGGITGTLSNQTDLQNALNLKIGTTTSTGLTPLQAVLTNASGILTTLPYSYTNTDSSIVERDSTGNSAFNNVIGTVTQISSSNQTITMTYGSSQGQEIYGTASTTFNLPDSTHLYQGEQFQFNNNSTGNLLVYLHDGTTLLGVVPSMDFGVTICDNNSTVNGDWDIHYWIPSLNSYLSTTSASQIYLPLSASTSLPYIPYASSTLYATVANYPTYAYASSTYLPFASSSLYLTAVGITSANGVSGTWSSPNLTISLGAITPTTINGEYFGGGAANQSSNVTAGASMPSNSSGQLNTAIGVFSLALDQSGNSNTGLGYGSLRGQLSNGSVGLGYYSGYYSTSTGNELFINNQDRTNYTGDITKSLIYGQFNSATSSQQLTVNGTLNTFTIKPSCIEMQDMATTAVKIDYMYASNTAMVVTSVKPSFCN